MKNTTNLGRRNTARSVCDILVVFVVMLCLVLCGCRRAYTGQNIFNWSNIERYEPSLSVNMINEEVMDIFPDVERRKKEALERVNDKVLEERPFLIQAMLCGDINEPELLVVCLDEDKDFDSVKFKETQIDANGKESTIEEEYPILVAQYGAFKLSRSFLPVHIRNTQQRKDELLWLKYKCQCLGILIDSMMAHIQHKSINISGNEMEMPPLYASLPQPGHVRVMVTIIDKCGNESEPVELQNHLYRINRNWLLSQKVKIFKEKY